MNITNTRYTGEGGAPAGDCRSEREPNIALNNDGDYLNIMYVLDLDAGFWWHSEGAPTNNPVIWHRVEKSELIEEFNENAVWLRNHPMHLDSTQFWEDSLDWDWEAHGGSFFLGADLIDTRPDYEKPSKWNIVSVYPNPFNRTVHAVISVPVESRVKAEVYNLLGQRVAVIDPGRLHPGNHCLTWTAEGTSGVYFLKVSNETGWKDIRKIVYLK